MKRKLFGFTSLVLAVMGILFFSTLTSAKNLKKMPPIRPMIFVHGYSGSAAQFQAQALRFTSNGYPQNYIAAHEYDSTFSINTMDDIHDGLDQLIATLLEETGSDQVDILGHSLGTTVMRDYLESSPERAACNGQHPRDFFALRPKFERSPQC